MNEMNSAYFHLASNPEAYQPVRNNNFRFIADFSQINLFGDTRNANTKFDPNTAQQVIDFSVISFDVPTFSQEELPISRGNSKIYFAGVPTFENKTLRINDFIGADGKSILRAWQACSYDVHTDTIPSSTKYKINAKVFEYTSDGRAIREWTLYGCWVTGIQEDGWDNTNGSVKTCSATIRYDKAIQERAD